MSSIRFEAFLAKLYIDGDVRSAFLDDPYHEAIKAGLTKQEADALLKIDRTGLELFAKSLEHKRSRREANQGAKRKDTKRAKQLFQFLRLHLRS